LALILVVNEISKNHLTIGEQYLLKYYVVQWEARIIYGIHMLVLRVSTLSVQVNCIFLRKTRCVQIYTYICHLSYH